MTIRDKASNLLIVILVLGYLFIIWAPVFIVGLSLFALGRVGIKLLGWIGIDGK